MEIAVCTRPQLAIATSGNVRKPALRSVRAIPADRQGEDERHQQTHEMVEAVAPDAEHLGH